MKKMLLACALVLIFNTMVLAAPVTISSPDGQKLADVTKDKLNVNQYSKKVQHYTGLTALLYAGACKVKTINFSSTAVKVSYKETSQNLASAALSYTTNFGRYTRIKSVQIHSSVAISETVTVKFNSSTGSNYDTTLASQALVSESNFYFSPENDLILRPGDEIDVTCTNANTTGTVYVTIKGEAYTAGDKVAIYNYGGTGVLDETELEFELGLSENNSSVSIDASGADFTNGIYIAASSTDSITTVTFDY